jgi:hypothetical protein
VVIIGGIYGGVFTLTEASAVAVLYALEPVMNLGRLPYSGYGKHPETLPK